jgi:transposase/transposase-like protein
LDDRKHTLYAWKTKFDEHGPAGSMDAPRGGPKGSRMPELTKRTILMLKQSNPAWGCQRISDMLVRGPALPASPTAVARVLHEAGYQMEEVTTRRGRKPLGAQLADRLEGSEHAKLRLKVILETLAGRQTIPEACEQLGIQDSMLHRVRSEVLQTALDRLEPRPMGRPPLAPSPQDQRVAELEEENLRLRAELRAAEIRRELAEKLPGVSRPAAGPGKKTTHSSPRSWKHRRKRTAP